MAEEPDDRIGGALGGREHEPPPSLGDPSPTSATGDGQALHELLVAALKADPGTAEGRAVRQLAGVAHVDRARELVARAAGLAADEAERNRADARQRVYEAILIEQVRLAPAATTVEEPAMPEVACLLDPPPDPPADVLAWATTLGARVRWPAPKDNGKPISGYDVTPTPKPLLGLTINRSGTDADVKGLAPGTTYTFTVTATNADGTSPPSLPSNAVRPDVSRPGSPTVTAKTVGALATVEWSTPTAGAPFSAFWVTAYDATRLTAVLPVRKLAGDARSTSFENLPKGSYVYGVRAFNAGGAGEEARSTPLDFQPAPSPFTPTGLPKPKIDPLDLFDLGSASELLKPDLLAKRLGPALEKANKWRYEYLRSLAVKAAGDTLQYEQFLGQVLQMTLGKVTSAQMLLSPVLQATIDDLLKNISTIGSVATSGPVQDVVKRVGDAVATALALEGLIFFLLDDSPLDFWVGLFDGMIRDVAHFDTGLSRTRGFLHDDYFGGLAGAKLIEAVGALVDEIDAQVTELMKPLEKAVKEIGTGVIEALRLVVDSIDETMVAVSATTGSELAVSTPFPAIAGLITQLQAEVDKLRKALIDAIHGLLQDPRDLLVEVILIFIAYPILGIMVISFALGPIGAAILGAIVVIAAVELIRLVARLLAGPLLDSLNDARRKVLEVLAELSAILSTTIGLLKNPVAQLQQVAGHLLALEQLLPRQFMNGVAALVGEARRALLGQATELALAAERALGMENATAFDVIRPNYDSGLPKAPGLPGGTDETLLAGMAMLRDLNALDRLRTRVFDGKEVVVTQRLSLYGLLGGLGNPVGAVGAAANALAGLAKGGDLILTLTEAAVIEHGYPGLYRAMVVDIKPIGLLAAASVATSALPVGIPLSVTHLGRSRMRVRRDANPDAPPISVPDVLQKASDVYADALIDKEIGPKDGQPAGVLAAIEKLALDAYKNPNVREAAGWFIVPPTITDQIVLTFLKELPTALAERARPILDRDSLAAVVTPVIRAVFASPLPEGKVRGTGTPQDPVTWQFPTKAELKTALDARLAAGGAVNQLRGPLRSALVGAHRRQAQVLQGQVAKWAGAGYEEDRDPHVRALGYVTLVQDLPVETAVYNLVPDLAPAAGGVGGLGAGPQPAPAARITEAPATALQYRTFENRGVEGDWLLSVQSVLSPGTLVDLLLEVTIRGCYDERLAATVKADRDRAAGLLDRAKAVAAGANKVLTLPGALPELLAGASEIRTLHFSLRAHRDSVLQHALAAAEAAGSRLVDGLDLKDGLVPLGAMDPFTPLAKSGLKKVTLRFQMQRPQSLGVLNGDIPVTPQMLCITDLLTQSDAGAVVGLGLLVIPSVKATRPGAGVPVPPPEDFAIKALDLDPLLRSYLPQLDQAGVDDLDPKTAGRPGAPKNNFEKNRTKALFITLKPPPAPVSLKTIWHKASLGSSGTPGPEAAADAPRIGVDLGDALDNEYIHDVIFSLSVHVPVTRLQTAPGIL
jgi:hypothetical protein